jgi:hypothetical protein
MPEMLFRLKESDIKLFHIIDSTKTSVKRLYKEIKKHLVNLSNYKTTIKIQDKYIDLNDQPLSIFIDPIEDPVDIHIERTYENSDNDIQIFLKTLTGRTITININKDATINDLKYAYFVKDNKLERWQNVTLCFAGTTLQNDKTLSFYKIQSDCTIHAILNLRGGMFHETSGRNANYEALQDCIISIEPDL